MAKIYKISGYIIDVNEDVNEDDLQWALERYDFSIKHFKAEAADIGEWYDEHPLNYYKSDISECEKYFSNEKTAHWEWYEHAYDWNLGGYVCSNCHMKNDNLPGFNEDKLDPYMFAGSHFCPCCGRRMAKEN